MLVHFFKNHIWDNLQVCVPMAIIHHVENTNCNLKRSCSQGRLRLDASHQREPVVEGLCLECPNSVFLTAKKITRSSEPFKSRLEKKNLSLHGLTVGKPSADFLRAIFSLFFFFSCTFLWSVLHESVIVYFGKYYCPCIFSSNVTINFYPNMLRRCLLSEHEIS